MARYGANYPSSVTGEAGFNAGARAIDEWGTRVGQNRGLPRPGARTDGRRREARTSS